MDTIATLKGLKCPHCGSEQIRATGTKGALGAAVATGATLGALGNLAAGSSAAANRATEPLQYKCSACGAKFQSMPLEARPEDVLPQPCTVTFTRGSSVVGAAVVQIVYLNGVKMGPVKNGQSIVFPTFCRENVVFVTDQYGVAFKDEYRFAAQPGGSAAVRFCRGFSQGRDAAPTPAVPAKAAPAPAAQKTSFCYRCGEPMPEGGRFCIKCGEPRFEADAAPAPAAPYRPGTQSAGRRPQRAVWAAGILLAAWAALFLLQGLFRGRLIFCLDIHAFITMAVLGVSCWLCLERGAAYKAIGAAGALVCILMSAGNQNAVHVNSQRVGVFGLGNVIRFSDPYFMLALRQSVLPVLLTFGAAFLFGFLFREKPEDKRRNLTGCCCAGVYLLYTLVAWLIRNRSAIGRMGPLRVLSSVDGLIFDALMLYLTFLFLGSLCGMRRSGVRLRGLGLAWGWIGAAGMLAGAIATVAATTGRAGASILCTGSLALAAAGLVGYILLLTGRAVGLYVIVGASALVLGGQFAYSLNAIMYGASSRYLSLFISSILGAVNPVLAGLAVRSAQDAPARPASPQAPAAAQRTSGFHKAAAIVNIVVGALLIIPLIGNILADPETAFILTFTALIALLLGFGIGGLAAQRAGGKPYPGWLKVINLILFILCALLVAVVLLGLIVTAFS